MIYYLAPDSLSFVRISAANLFGFEVDLYRTFTPPSLKKKFLLLADVPKDCVVEFVTNSGKVSFFELTFGSVIRLLQILPNWLM